MVTVASLSLSFPLPKHLMDIVTEQSPSFCVVGRRECLNRCAFEDAVSIPPGIEGRDLPFTRA
jgi:hypothetical protein